MNVDLTDMYTKIAFVNKIINDSLRTSNYEKKTLVTTGNMLSSVSRKFKSKLNK